MCVKYRPPWPLGLKRNWLVQIFPGHLGDYRADLRDSKALWNPVGPSCALAVSFSLRASGTWYMSTNTEFIITFIIYKGHKVTFNTRPLFTLLPVRSQVIIFTNARFLFIGPFRTNLGEILIKIKLFSYKKNVNNVICKMAAILSQPQCVDITNQKVLSMFPWLCCKRHSIYGYFSMTSNLI